MPQQQQQQPPPPQDINMHFYFIIIPCHDVFTKAKNDYSEMQMHARRTAVHLAEDLLEKPIFLMYCNVRTLRVEALCTRRFRKLFLHLFDLRANQEPMPASLFISTTKFIKYVLTQVTRLDLHELVLTKTISFGVFDTLQRTQESQTIAL